MRMHVAWPVVVRGLAAAAAGATLAGCAGAPKAVPVAEPPASGGRLLSLPAPDDGEIGGGTLSPDASGFAYQVSLPDKSVQLWLLDLESLRARRLTGGAGGRSVPAWSPDGARLAYERAIDPPPGTRQSLRGPSRSLVVFDLAEREERIVFPLRGTYTFAASVRWSGPDSVVFFHSYVWPGEGETWIAAADGSGAHRLTPSEAAARRPVLSPTGTRRAFSGTCCDAAVRALRVAPATTDAADERGTCRAGPVSYVRHIGWARDGSEVMFAAPGSDSVARLWSVPVETGRGDGAARVVRRPPGTITSVGMSATDLLAVGLRARSDSALLWLVDRPEAALDDAATLPTCPSQFPRVAAFARDEGIEGRIVVSEALRLADLGFREFWVRYGVAGDDPLRVRAGRDAGGRIGWIGPECRIGRYGDRTCPVDAEGTGTTYRPPPDAPALWSTSFLARLAEHGRDRGWAELLLGAPDLPPSVVDSLMASGRYDPLLVEDPRVRERLDRLLVIYGRNVQGSAAWRGAFERLRRHGPELVRDPETPRDLLRRFAADLPGRRPPDSRTVPLAHALLEHPELGRDPDVLFNLARLPAGIDVDVTRTAGRRLLAHPEVTTGMLRRVAANLAADSGVADMLFADRRILDDPLTMRSLARSRWDEWRVAERARGLVRERREREARGPPARAVPLVLPDAWGPAEGVPYYDPWSALRDELWQLDPLAEWMPSPVRRIRSRTDVVREACSRAADPDGSEEDLATMIEGAVYATSTALANCLLDVPAVRSSPRLLRLLATMIDVNHDPRYPGPGEPTIDEIRDRARALLARAGEEG